MKTILEFIVKNKLRNDFTKELDQHFDPWDYRALASQLHLRVWDEDDSDCIDAWEREISKEIGMKRPDNVKTEQEKKEATEWNIAANKLGKQTLIKIWKDVGGLLTDTHYWGKHD